MNNLEMNPIETCPHCGVTSAFMNGHTAGCPTWDQPEPDEPATPEMEE